MTLVAEAVAKTIGAAAEIFMASTGVIGEPLDGTRIARASGSWSGNAREDKLMDAARAIMTTDTYPKVATAFAPLGNTIVTINGIAKGAGMIAPDMATMLSYVFTDAPIASGAAGHAVEVGRALVQRDHGRQRHLDVRHADAVCDRRRRRRGPADRGRRRRALAPFRRALDKLLRSLAQQVVRDGEGARKFIEVNVEGAATRKAAKRIAMSIANSPLVKTAVGGEDANWGRVVMAVGKAGEKAERDKLDIWFGKIRVAHQGFETRPTTRRKPRPT